MSRNASLSLAALALLIAGPGYSETGVREARAAARVSVSIPSVHGADIPSRPAESGRAVFAASRTRQSPRLELPALSVMSSNGDGSIQLVRRVRDTGAVTVASSPRGGRPRAREDVSTTSRSGATGWTELHDELEIPAVAAASRGPKHVTVIYEVWSF